MRNINNMKEYMHEYMKEYYKNNKGKFIKKPTYCVICDKYVKNYYLHKCTNIHTIKEKLKSLEKNKEAE